MEDRKRCKLGKFEATIAAYSIAWEGSICIGLCHNKETKRRKSHLTLLPSVSIGGTDKNLLNTFCALVGYGKVRLTKRGDSLLNHKPVWQWKIRAMGEIKSFCEEILPYLPAKRKQAELMIVFCNGRLNAIRPYTDRDWAIHREMKRLNHRGL